MLREIWEQTMALLATPVSSASSIAAAESLSLLAASFGSIPVSVDFTSRTMIFLAASLKPQA